MQLLFVLVKERQPFFGRRIKIQAAHGLSIVVVNEDSEISLCVPVCNPFRWYGSVEYGFNDVERLQFFFRSNNLARQCWFFDGGGCRLGYRFPGSFGSVLLFCNGFQSVGYGIVDVVTNSAFDKPRELFKDFRCEHPVVNLFAEVADEIGRWGGKQAYSLPRTALCPFC